MTQSSPDPSSKLEAYPGPDPGSELVIAPSPDLHPVPEVAPLRSREEILQLYAEVLTSKGYTLNANYFNLPPVA